MQPIFDTLDLYHAQGVDARAIAAAFKELAENNPNAELEIVAIERRGDDKIMIRAQTATTANKSALSQEYFINYNQIKALAEKDFQELIASQKSQISRLETMITTALERPNFYAETYNQGDTIMTSTYNNMPNSRFDGSLINADKVNAEQIGNNTNTVKDNNNRTIQGDSNQGVLGDNNQVTQ